MLITVFPPYFIKMYNYQQVLLSNCWIISYNLIIMEEWGGNFVAIIIQNRKYELVQDFRNGFHEEAFRSRYSEVLTKYDYIVGDWGYGQLRLKGFYANDNPKSTADNKIEFLEEYLYEYCNFGCAHFVLKRVDS